MADRRQRFFSVLYGDGGLPADFSAVAAHQSISASLLAEIGRFIRVFERVTGRRQWQQGVLGKITPPVRSGQQEHCFFSAWDLHLPPQAPERWQLIEFNDNGSGFLFAAWLNRCYWEAFGPLDRVQPPLSLAEQGERLVAMLAADVEAVLGRRPSGGVLILDDGPSLERGKFRAEHRMLADLLERQGWTVRIAAPQALEEVAGRLQVAGLPLAVVINRSTDFFWRGAALAPLWRAWRSGSVYVTPNPLSYATRSDKRLLEWLSLPERDGELGIEPEERALLAAHVPPTRLLDWDNRATLAAARADWVFKPCHGHAGLGVLDPAEVGAHRLKRLLKKGVAYVAQQRVAKAQLNYDSLLLWCDLRVWAWQGQPYLLSGRASRSPDRIDLSPPGGWLPTLVAEYDNNTAR